uniref:RRM domain-containing protein n=1 Tax=Globodera rostochiensis TaxID=31243 RepID=A0A914HJP5_GLORO
MNYSLLRLFTNRFATSGSQQQQQLLRQNQNRFEMSNNSTASAIFLRNIKWITGRNQIEQHFSRFGRIKETKMFFDPKTGLHRGIAIVQFVSSEGAAQAVQYKPHMIDGGLVHVRYESKTIGSPTLRKPKFRV